MKLKNYTMSFFAGMIFCIGYFIFLDQSDHSDNGVAVQNIANYGLESNLSDLAENSDDASQEDYIYKRASSELNDKIFITQDERRGLFKQLGLEYLEREEFDYAPAQSMDARLTESYREDIEGCDDYAMYYQDDIQEGVLAPMSVRWLGSDVGYGVFAEDIILQGEFVGIYTGSIKERTLVEDKDYAWAYPAKTIEGEALSLDGRFKGNELRFINDNVDPNCVMVFIIGKDNLWHGCYIALKDIKKGEQLFISYGPAYWQTRDYKYQELTAAVSL